MTYIARNDQSVIGRWWYEIDRGLIWLVLPLIFAGWVVVFSGSAQEVLQGSEALTSFSVRKLLFVCAALISLFGLSLLQPAQVERLTPFSFICSILLLLSIFVIGVSENNATRWIAIPGLPFAPQPTEFAKPALVLMIAFFLSRAHIWGFGRALLASGAVFLGSATLVAVQPDISQAVFFLLIFLGLLFFAGLAFEWIFLLIVLGCGVFSLAYVTLAHVRSRLDGFFKRILGADGDKRDHNDMAADAFRDGGLGGLGLGEGRLKTFIPEAKNDMPLAIIGEELGLFGSLVLFSSFIFLWRRVQRRLPFLDTDFQRLGALGLIFFLVAQALVNIFYTVGLIPTTGITLPFFSDGGSSLIASAASIGLLLALTRQRRSAGA